MKDLGIALVWLAVQVTAVAFAGLVLTILAGRRTPAGGVAVASTALAATVGLGFLALCPLPAWWTWNGLTDLPVAATAADSPSGHDREPTAMPPTPTTVLSHEGGMPLSRLFSAIQVLRKALAVARERGRSPRWTAIVAGLAGTATALGVLRLLLGLWAIRHGWRRSQPVNDSDLLHLVEELCMALDVKQPVTVRESADLTTAATIGWWKPVLLLPADWRRWTGAQTRVVVAHELAHVAGGDFAAWLLAQLSVALYFWHPLVHSLAGRLRLHHELAADASAAALAGGRPVYLRALAELALQADGLARGWPATAFLSAKHTLLRRIEMLRLTDDSRKRLVSRNGRRLSIALLLVVALTVSALRGPVRQTWAAAPAPASTAAQVAPFDLSLLGQGASEADGVYAIRPAALLNRPGMERVRQEMNAWIDLLTCNFDTKAAGIHVEDVEQVMGRIYFKGENKVGKRSLVMSLNVLRTTKDIDWAKLGDQCGLKMKKHRWKGETYVSAALPAALANISGVNGQALFWAPDARTLILDDESTIKARIAAKLGGKKLATPEFAQGWDTVSRGFFAVAIDNRDRRLIDRTMTKAELKEALSDPEQVEYHLARLYQEASTVVVGFEGSDDLRFNLRASAATPAGAARMVKRFEGALATAKVTAANAPDDVDQVAVGFLRKALDRASVHREGAVVTIHADVLSGLDALLAHVLNEMPRKEK
jgi:beta-lactamase regulating signal transducer with metallopeptidase domain